MNLEKVDAEIMHIGKLEQKELLKYLKVWLDDVCYGLAVKFNLFDSLGRPRKAFIADSLLRFHCTCCLQKVFAHMRICDGDVDALYSEMHGFAVNLLSGVLMEMLKGKGFRVCCEDAGDYGRADVVVKSATFGLVVKVNHVHVVVEVKTGRSISFAQLFRYLLWHPDAVLVVWRVGMRQVFTLRGRELQTLLCMYISSAISRALKLLNGEVTECSHNPSLHKYAFISEPQKILDNFFHSLTESLPKAISAIFNALKEA